MLKHQEDAEDLALLFELLGKLEWKGGIDILVQLRNLANNDPLEFNRFIQDILLQGYDPEEEVKKVKNEQEGSPDKRQTETDWKRLISQYCRAYPGAHPRGVWELEFPFFMEFLPEARRKEAADHIYSAFEASFAMGGSKEIMKSWRSQAGWDDKKKAPPKKDRKTKELTEEQLQRNREKMKNIFNRS